MSAYSVRIKLGALLKDRGISDREFARMIGIRHPSVGEMCANKTLRLPLSTLARICEVLDVEITDVLELEKPRD